jgi:HEAT repeat protein/putative zinc finger protein
MDCELAQQQIALFAYGELPDDQCHALEGHLSACKRCQEEFAAVQALQQAMALAPALEPSANMLTQARMRLEEALDSMPRTGWLMRVQQSIFRGVHMLGRAPVAASALLVLGLSAGSWGGYQFAARNHRPMDSVIEAEGKIANVTGIVREPHTENVEVHFNRLVPETAQGSLDDKRIRELLLLGAQSPVNPGVQQNSVSLLAEECGAGHQCDGGPIRQSLLVALRYDKSSEVRLKALDGLQPYVAQDMRVRDAVLEALMADPDSTVRSRAIEVLQPVGADSSVREVLHTVASQDDNPHIRTVSQEALDEYPHIQ